MVETSTPPFLYRPSSLAMSTGMCTTLGGVVGSATISLLFCALAAPGSVSAAAASRIKVEESLGMLSSQCLFYIRPIRPLCRRTDRGLRQEAAMLPDRPHKNNEAG